jgi:hypothetical protein
MTAERDYVRSLPGVIIFVLLHQVGKSRGNSKDDCSFVRNLRVLRCSWIMSHEVA